MPGDWLQEEEQLAPAKHRQGQGKCSRQRMLMSLLHCTVLFHNCSLQPFLRVIPAEPSAQRLIRVGVLKPLAGDDTSPII